MEEYKYITYLLKITNIELQNNKYGYIHTENFDPIEFDNQKKN